VDHFARQAGLVSIKIIFDHNHHPLLTIGITWPPILLFYFSTYSLTSLLALLAILLTSFSLPFRKTIFISSLAIHKQFVA